MRSVLTFNGGMNQDVSPMYLKQGDVISRRNARVSVSSGGDSYVNKPLKGTVPVNIVFPKGKNKAIGWTTYLEKGGFIYFNYNSNRQHGIYWFDGDTNTVVLISPVLNFSENSIVDARVMGDLLIWTDDINDPRVLSIERAITYSETGNVSGRIYEVGVGVISGTVKSFLRDELVGTIVGTVKSYAANQANHGDITGTVITYFDEVTVSGTINEQT